MTVKSQLHACGDSLMVAVRAAQRAGTPDVQNLKTLRACQDIIERLEQSATEVSAVEIELALSVLTQASIELGRRQAPARTVLRAVRNAVERLERLRTDFSA